MAITIVYDCWYLRWVIRQRSLTGWDLRGQRSEELTCDLIGAMAVRAYVADTPDYESVARRIVAID
jgi:hypothetical protein